VESVQTDYIDSAVRGELDTLRLLVEETDGNVIAFVRYRRVTEREAGVRYLKEQLSLPVEERVLSEERQNPIALLDNLPDERRCLQFYDLEAALPEVTGYLNVNREAYADVPHALVFWVGEHGLREVATNAPDFWAWRSGVFDVRSKFPDSGQSVSWRVLADDIQFTNRGDLERRAQLYEGLIQRYEGEDDEYVARLRLKLAGTLYWLGRLGWANEEVHRAKEYADRERDNEVLSQAYRLLGVIVQDQRNLDKAEEWYRKSLGIAKGLGNQRGVSKTYHELGILAQARRKLEKAERLFKKSAEIKEQTEDRRLAATSYHQLGNVAQEQGNLEKAEQWYRRAEEIFEHFGDEHSLAKTYHGLGIVSQRQRNLEEAEELYHKAIEIAEQLGDEQGTAKTYHQLGIVSQEQGELEGAKARYSKAAEIFERLDDERWAAKTYLNIGAVAQSRRHFEEAEARYRRALEVFEHLDDEWNASLVHWQWGRLGHSRGDLREAGNQYIKAIQGFNAMNDDRNMKQVLEGFLEAYEQTSQNVQKDLRQQWIDAGLPPEQLDDFLK